MTKKWKEIFLWKKKSLPKKFSFFWYFSLSWRLFSFSLDFPLFPVFLPKSYEMKSTFSTYFTIWSSLLQITWFSKTSWSTPCFSDDKRRKNASRKRNCHATERRTGKTRQKVKEGNKQDDIWFFHISWNKSKFKTALLSWLFGQEEFISMKQLNQSATSKGLMYRRGMHGVYIYILQVYIPKAYHV